MRILVMLAVVLAQELAAPGPSVAPESLEDVEAISRIQEVVAKTYKPGGSIPKEEADQLERFMQPDKPVLTRMRAMKFGQVIGQARFKKVLLAAWKDKDPRVRRTAVAKADTVEDLWPEEVPSLADDPDAGTRAAWEMWMHTIKVRREQQPGR
jgi:hypothetical protein